MTQNFNFLSRRLLKQIAITVLLLSFFSAFATQAKKKRFVVSGVVTQTSDYCGGAAPSQGLLDLLSTPQALEGKKMFVRKGDVNNIKKRIIAYTVSDENGNFKLELFAGTYCLIFEEKVQQLKVPDNDIYNKWDEACLKSAHAKCEYTFVVKNKALSGIKINFHKHCSYRHPCSRYNGPTPP